MKKIKFEKKLSLNKEAVTELNDDQMNNVKGGAALWTLIFCRPSKSCVTICQQTTCGTGDNSNRVSVCLGGTDCSGT